MSTEKQLIANQQNAQLSTGPITVKGMTIVSKNAIKHGIFTKDLIVSSGIAKEDEGEYQEMLGNLVDCLLPQNQMKSLLVEKIALDFWRLRRLIRFENGSIKKYLETILKDFYSYRKNNQQIHDEIEYRQQYIIWIASYVEHLKKEKVNFDEPIWKSDDFDSDIIEDFYLIAKTFNDLNKEVKDNLYYRSYKFEEMGEILRKNGYSSNKDITTKLLEVYENLTILLKKEIVELEHKKIDNKNTEELSKMLGMIPQIESTDKILKYERSIQKSIYQNLFLLKKLQGIF